jgi:parvulin-like peptidyl-prolyl isomerase
VSGGTFKGKLMAMAKETTLDQFMEIARPQMRQRLNYNISNVVLYKQAKRELGEKVDETLDKLVDKEWRRWVLEKHTGNDAEADEDLKQRGLTRATFKEQKRRVILAQYLVSSKLSKDRPITHGELVAAYDQMKGESFSQPASVQFRLIDIQPDRVDVANPDENRIDKARTLAEGLARKIRAGEDFAALAQESSHGLRREAGGLWPPRDPNSFVAPYDGIAAKAMEMQVGEVAGPIEVSGHFFIVKLEQKQPKGYKPLKDVQNQVEQKILDDRYNEVLRQFDTEIATQTSMVDTNAFLDRCLEQIYKQARVPQQ